MTDLEFILRKCKTSNLLHWNDGDIEVCKKKLMALPRDDLWKLYSSEWMSRLNPLYNTIIELIYKENLDRDATNLNSMNTTDLISILKNPQSQFRYQMISEILYFRYDTMTDEDKNKVYNMLIEQGYIINK